MEGGGLTRRFPGLIELIPIIFAPLPEHKRNPSLWEIPIENDYAHTATGRNWLVSDLNFFHRIKQKLTVRDNSSCIIESNVLKSNRSPSPFVW